MKILLTGGSGLLGKELIKLFKEADGDGYLFPRITVDAPSSKDLDITKTIDKLDYDLIVHCAAYTNVNRSEIDKRDCYDINVTGVFNLLENNSKIPFVYISTEFAAQPVNFYSYTKLMAEELVKGMTKEYLILRTLFKTRPFAHPKAFVDQWTNGDYLDVIAPLIVKTILEWDKKPTWRLVGTGRKTMFDLARQTKPDVLPMFVGDIAVKRPTDYI